MSYFWVMIQCDTKFDRKINEDQICHQNKCRSQWPLFHSPVIVPCIVKCILYDYESGWPKYWPQNKCRSQWPTFHHPVILITCINLMSVCCIRKHDIVWYYKSVWPKVWPQNKCSSQWPVFHGPVILPYILKSVWCINIILIDYESVWPKFDTKINLGYIYLYFFAPAILPFTRACQ